MASRLILPWGTHSMQWDFDPEGTSIVTFTLKKDNGEQVAEEKVPRHIVEDDVKKAWADQDQDWLRLTARDIPAVAGVSPQLYFANRVIHFERHQVSLMWGLLHFDQVPFDAFMFVPMSTEFVRRIRAMNAY